MGQKLTTPLSLTLDHWTEVKARAQELSFPVKKGKWKALCATEWPAFKVGWPAEGSFHRDLIQKIKSVVFQTGSRGQPDQGPYVMVWIDLSENPPPWVKCFLPPNQLPPQDPMESAILPLKAPQVAEKKKAVEEREESRLAAPPAKIYPDTTDLLLLDNPPPYRAQRVQGDSHLQQPPAPATPSAPSLISSLPPTPNTPGSDPEEIGRGEGPAMGTRSRAAVGMDIARALPLRAYGLTEPAALKAKVADPMAQGAAKALPLRAFGSLTLDNGGEQVQLPALQYWPFSSSDLFNWKINYPSFSDDPGKLTGLMGSLMNTHQPTWDDCQQLLITLFTTEEQDRIIAEARKNIHGPDGMPTTRPNILDMHFPLVRPDWDYNTPEGRERLSNYRQLLMRGLRAAARRPTNLAKVNEVIQGPNESPSLFLERLMEAYRRYTPFDPQAEEQRASVVMSFIGQSAADIRRKLQRLEGIQGLTLRDLVREAEKVFHKRETPEEREERRAKEKEDREDRRDQRRNRELARVLALAVEKEKTPRQGASNLGHKKTRLERDQCRYCKEKGHWAKECPKKKQSTPKPILALEQSE